MDRAPDPEIACPRVGLVVIGRNEAARLEVALDSALRSGAIVVYVDSCSSDDSVQKARSRHVPVVELDQSVPLTAARARNKGFELLQEISPRVGFVQFMDGDCELVAGWVEAAVRFLSAREDVAVVCGRRREVRVNASPYNRLLELEWDRPTGTVDACGGDFMVRASVFRDSGGFDPRLIAGEEPELCFRLRRGGWKVVRLENDMTRHDSGVLSLRQSWKRAIRYGHACTGQALRHGLSGDSKSVRRMGSIVMWGVAIPGVGILGAWATGGASLVLFLLYAILYGRVFRHERSRGRSSADARLQAGWVVLAKFGEAIGCVQFLHGKLLGNESGLVEYKSLVT
jgi:GT2 family glycosyltransferase